MLPVLQTIQTFNPPSTLVATALPESSAVRVAPDVIPPSVSNAQITNNARANSATSSSSDSPSISLAVSDAAASVASGSDGAAASAPSVSFLAQLLGQNNDPAQTQVILVQYQKLVNFGVVKYLPSDPPLPELANNYEQLLQQAQPQPSPQQTAQPQQQAVQSQQAQTDQQIAQATQQLAEGTVQASQAAYIPQAIPEPVRPANTNTPADESLPAPDDSSPATAQSNASAAYRATATRSFVPAQNATAA